MTVYYRYYYYYRNFLNCSFFFFCSFYCSFVAFTLISDVLALKKVSRLCCRDPCNSPSKQNVNFLILFEYVRVCCAGYVMIGRFKMCPLLHPVSSLHALWNTLVPSPVNRLDDASRSITATKLASNLGCVCSCGYHFLHIIINSWLEFIWERIRVSFPSKILIKPSYNHCRLFSLISWDLLLNIKLI